MDNWGPKNTTVWFVRSIAMSVVVLSMVYLTVNTLTHRTQVTFNTVVTVLVLLAFISLVVVDWVQLVKRIKSEKK